MRTDPSSNQANIKADQLSLGTHAMKLIFLCVCSNTKAIRTIRRNWESVFIHNQGLLPTKVFVIKETTFLHLVVPVTLEDGCNAIKHLEAWENSLELPSTISAIM